MPPFTPEPTLCELCLIREFSDVRLGLLRRVCGLLFFLYYLQAFDLLEGEAHDAAVLALVLEVDCLLVVVDHDLRGHPAAVVEPLCPLRDVFVLYFLGLLAHPFAPCLASMSLPRRGSIYSTEGVRDCHRCWVGVDLARYGTGATAEPGLIVRLGAVLQAWPRTS